mgnify:CR=1 FL=1
MPFGSFSKMSPHWAAISAARTSPRVAFGREARTFSRIEALNRRLFWNTKAIWSMSTWGSICRTSAPPTFTMPEVTSQKRGIRLAAVVLPPPEGPTRATVRPGSTVKETWERAGVSAPL